MSGKVIQGDVLCVPHVKKKNMFRSPVQRLGYAFGCRKASNSSLSQGRAALVVGRCWSRAQGWSERFIVGVG